MAKVTLKVPEIVWRKETMQVPPGKVDVVRAALKAQQERITSRLVERNEEIARELEKATRESSSSRRGRLLTLGVGALVGAGVGLLVAPSTGKSARARIGQGAGKVARTTATQAAGKVKAVRARVGGDGEQETGPESISDRVLTQLGEDASMRAAPRINVNTEPGGKVYLRGIVPSPDLREKAEKIARKQPGVTEVMNELTIANDLSDGATTVQ